jgi:hypothetical protein
VIRDAISYSIRYGFKFVLSFENRIKGNLKMKKIKTTAENSDILRKKVQNLNFYWVFNPDGSITDYSKNNYSRLLENNYKSATSTELYLGTN